MDDRVEISLMGPDFIEAADKLSRQLESKFVTQLNVYNLCDGSVTLLLTALNILRQNFFSGTVIGIFFSKLLSPQLRSAISAASGVDLVLNQFSFDLAGEGDAGLPRIGLDVAGQYGGQFQNKSSFPEPSFALGAGQFKTEFDIQSLIAQMQKESAKLPVPGNIPNLIAYSKMLEEINRSRHEMQLRVIRALKS